LTALRVSVVIVSRDRPEALRRCLIGVGQLRYPDFEIVVVADEAGCEAVAQLALQDRIKCVPFQERNISAARNAGIAVAAGTVIAFIDDDAVPEPTWLSHLIVPFQASPVAAAGGYVIGRNGISFQWKARDISADGRSRPIDLDTEEPTILRPRAGHGIKTEGTNMAFRRAVLVRQGGFDTAFRFYMDETDLNLRLAAEGSETAIVPRAQVHHGFAAGPYRRHDRVPTHLGEIGASTAVFLRKHGGQLDRSLRIAEERAVQKRRLLEHMVAARLLPGDVGRILSSFDAGVAEGERRQLGRGGEFSETPPVFLPFRPETADAGSKTILGRPLNRARRLTEAAAASAEGHTTSLYIFSPTARFHRVRFIEPGFWLQEGGLWGRSDRSDPLFRLWRRRARLSREVARVAPVRTGSQN